MNVLRLPFDQYQRYRLVADVVERLRPLVGDRPLRLLDVGGRTAILREFLPDDRVELVDIDPSDAKDLILGSGSALPFATESFDAVCAFDTLEHVPVEGRAAFVDECWRVTKSWLLLAGPYDAPRVRKAERLLDRFIRKKLGFSHRYLREHLDNGLPVRADIEQQLTAVGGQVMTIGHGNLERWLALLSLELYLDADPALREIAPAVYEYYNKNLYASDHAAPVYRHVILGAFNGAQLPDLAGLLAPPVAPKGSLTPFTELAQALCAFDAEREAWHAERAAFEDRATTLEADLDGHRKLVSGLRDEVEARKRVTRDLRSDLKGHRATLAEVERERRGQAKVVSELEVRCAELVEQTDALQSDLAGHKAVLATAHAELVRWETSVQDLVEQLVGERAAVAGLTAERDGLLLLRDNLAGDLEEHRVVLADVQGQVATWEGIVSGLAEDLERNRAELTAANNQRDTAQAIAEDQRVDLEGHRKRLAELEVENRALVEMREAAIDEKRQALEMTETLRSEREDGLAVIMELCKQRDEGLEVIAELKQSRDALADAQAACDRQREEALDVVGELTADLEGHRKRLAELESEHAALVAMRVECDAEKAQALDMAEILRRARDEALVVVSDLESDLDGHKLRLKELESEREALVEMREAAVAEKDTALSMTKDLGKQRDEALEVAGDLRSDLDGHKLRLKELETEHEALSELRDEALAERADLIEMRDAAVAEKDTALSMTKDLGKQRDEALEVARDLRSDLDGHKLRLKELESEHGALIEMRDEALAERADLIEMRDAAVAEKDTALSMTKDLGKQRDEALEVARDLRSDLDGHKLRLKELESEHGALIEMRDEALAERADLIEMRDAAVAEKDTALSMTKDLGKQRDEALEVARDLRSDLDGHKLRLKELESEHGALIEMRDAALAERDEALAVLAELRRLREQQDEVNTTLGSDLEQHRIVLAEQTRLLAELRGVLAARETRLVELEARASEAPEERDQHDREHDEQ